MISQTKRTKRKAFTLIELLVVIAIIGILATIVLTAVMDVKTKGKNSRIKGDMSQIRAAAEVYYNSNNYSYSGVCGQFNNNSTNLGILQKDIADQGGSATVTCTLSVNQAKYAVQALLSDKSTKVCVDSMGAFKFGSDAIGGVCTP